MAQADGAAAIATRDRTAPLGPVKPRRSAPTPLGADGLDGDLDGAVPGSHRMAAGNARLEAKPHLAGESVRKVTARSTYRRAVRNDRRTADDKRSAPDVLDEAERKFLEPVARYLAVLQEWALERPDEACSSPPPEGP